VAYVDLAAAKINTDAMRDIPQQAATTYRFFAFDQSEGKLHFAMDDPEDFQALEAIKFIAKKKGLSPEIYQAAKEDIDKALGGTTEVQAEIGTALRDFGQELAAADVASAPEADLSRLMEAAPVTKVVAVIIRHAIEGHASDIHVEPTEKELRIRYRIDGRLHTTLLLPKRIHTAVISRIKILSNLKIDESRLPQDGRFSSTVSTQAYDFRVSTIPTVYGEKAVLRILDKSKGAPSFEELGLWGEQQATFLEQLEAPHGIILISGPTGAGKSTTLFTALTRINKPEVNISTLEDPVEYEVSGVNQTQVNPDIGLSFATGLRNLLRQDPDVLMVGEIRDVDTAALSIHASLTGHLVLSTIHTNDAIGTIPRLVDMGIDPYLLTATLRLVVAQRLVARLCQDCKKEQPMPERLQESVLAELAKIPAALRPDANQQKPRVLYQAAGCPKCRETGLIGRVGIFEVVPITRQLRDHMNESADYDTLYDIARQSGAITMRQDGLLKALLGVVQYEDVLRATNETDE
jgi:type IV pilus assembly protein PilB